MKKMEILVFPSESLTGNYEAPSLAVVNQGGEGTQLILTATEGNIELTNEVTASSGSGCLSEVILNASSGAISLHGIGQLEEVEINSSVLWMGGAKLELIGGTLLQEGVIHLQYEKEGDFDERLTYGAELTIQGNLQIATRIDGAVGETLLGTVRMVGEQSYTGEISAACLIVEKNSIVTIQSTLLDYHELRVDGTLKVNFQELASYSSTGKITGDGLLQIVADNGATSFQSWMPDLSEFQGRVEVITSDECRILGHSGDSLTISGEKIVLDESLVSPEWLQVEIEDNVEKLDFEDHAVSLRKGTVEHLVGEGSLDLTEYEGNFLECSTLKIGDQILLSSHCPVAVTENFQGELNLTLTEEAETALLIYTGISPLNLGEEMCITIDQSEIIESCYLLVQSQNDFVWDDSFSVTLNVGQQQGILTLAEPEIVLNEIQYVLSVTEQGLCLSSQVMEDFVLGAGESLTIEKNRFDFLLEDPGFCSQGTLKVTASEENPLTQQDIQRLIALNTVRQVDFMGQPLQAFQKLSFGNQCVLTVNFDGGLGTNKADQLSFGKNSVIELGRLGSELDLLEGNNRVVLQANANGKILSSLKNLTTLSVSSGTKISVGKEKWQRFTILELEDIAISAAAAGKISIGKYCQVTLGNLVGSGNKQVTISIGAYSSFAAENMFGVSQVSVGGNSQLTAVDYQGLQNKTNSFKIGNGAVASLDSLCFGDKNDSLQIGNNAEVTLGSLQFGEGKGDKLSLGKNSTLILSNSPDENLGLEKFSIGKGSRVYAESEIVEQLRQLNKKTVTGYDTERQLAYVALR